MPNQKNTNTQAKKYEETGKEIQNHTQRNVNTQANTKTQAKNTGKDLQTRRQNNKHTRK